MFALTMFQIPENTYALCQTHQKEYLPAMPTYHLILPIYYILKMASYRNMTTSLVDIYMNKYKTVCSDKFIRISYFSTQRYAIFSITKSVSTLKII